MPCWHSPLRTTYTTQSLFMFLMASADCSLGCIVGSWQINARELLSKLMMEFDSSFIFSNGVEGVSDNIHGTSAGYFFGTEAKNKGIILNEQISFIAYLCNQQLSPIAFVSSRQMYHSQQHLFQMAQESKHIDENSLYNRSHLLWLSSTHD